MLWKLSGLGLVENVSVDDMRSTWQFTINGERSLRECFELESIWIVVANAHMDDT